MAGIACRAFESTATGELAARSAAVDCDRPIRGGIAARPERKGALRSAPAACAPCPAAIGRKVSGDAADANTDEAGGRPLGDHGDTFSLRLARMPQAVALVRHELRRWLDERGVST